MQSTSRDAGPNQKRLASKSMSFAVAGRVDDPSIVAFICL
jgi:hypothetical protein